jgi:hypothetical protein
MILGGDMTDGSRHDENPLIGRWQRVTELPPPAAAEAATFGQDPSLFPELIEFSGSRYHASKAPDQNFIVWDVGNYRLEGDQLSITLANDAFASYPVEFAGDEFTVVDATGHRTTYRRVR